MVKIFNTEVMKRKLLPILLCACTGTTMAQTAAYVDINNIKAHIECAKPFFNHYANSTGGFEVPAGSGKHTMFAAGLWMGGEDFNAQLKFAGTFYGQAGNDFQPGPIMNSSYYASQTSVWNRVWKIYRSEIDNHILNWQTVGYVAPADFLSWPAHGNTSMGMAAYLAPYYDYNGDNNYNPYDGDYPIINGDVAVFYIMNDDKLHTETGGDIIGAEVHVMAYAVDCNADSALNNTVFLNLKIINRSTQTLYNFSAGMFTDGDLGCWNDDYVGCDVARSMFYFNNGDLDDQDCNGQYGYGLLIPYQGIVVLGGLTRDADGIDNGIYPTAMQALSNGGICYPLSGTGYNDGIIDNERTNLTNFMYFNNDLSVTGNPQLAADYYDYLNSRWKDGSLLYFNGTGYFSDPDVTAAGNISANYMFPLNSDPLNWSTQGVFPSAGVPWSEITSGNASGDRRVIGGCGKTTLQPGAVHNLDLAYVFATDYVNPSDANNSALLAEYTDSLHSYFRHNQSPCGAFYHSFLHASEQKPLIMRVYPNPANEEIFIESDKTEKYSYELFDLTGKQTLKGKFQQRTRLDVHVIPTGLYFLHISASGQTTVHKIVIR